MGELRLELAPDPRHMDEIAGLAVALQQPGEIAEDAGIALGPRQRIGGIEAGAVELGKGGEIALDQAGAQLARDIAPGIVDQRDEVEAAGPAHRILEIQQAHGGDAAAAPPA